MMKANKLKKVSSQLKKSVTAHAKQADIIDGYLSSIKDKSPAMKKVKAKGGGTKKVCLPLAKIRSMSSGEKSKIVSAKRKAGAAGKYKRSSKSNTTGTSSGGSLKNWVKQDWRQVSNPELKCGEKSPTEKKGDVKRTIGRGKNFNKANDTGTGAAAGGGQGQQQQTPTGPGKGVVQGIVSQGGQQPHAEQATPKVGAIGPGDGVVVVVVRR